MTSHERGVFLSTLPASRRQRRLALAVVLASAAIFLALAPFARRPLGQVWAFIPIYESALVINDLVTAVLLFGQFSILRSRALQVLASAYLFTAFMTVAHALSFPGLFSPTGLLGAGAQSTAWLYMFWHVGFPLLVIAYTRLEISRGAASGGPGRASFAILGSAAVSFVVAGGFTLLATAGQGPLPAIMEDNRNRIVFVTGDILSREKREFLERTGAPHVLKPFDLREVRQLVHRMLAETGTGGSRGRH
jgi:hypothetical protein